MRQQSVQRINVAKIRAAKSRLGSVMDKTSGALKQLTAQGITSASPDDVAKALTEAAVPALEETMNVIQDVVEALPQEEAPLGDEGAGLGEDAGAGLGGGDEGETPLEASFENHNTQPGFKGAMNDDEDRLKDLEEKTASLLAENIAMKKANLSKEYASTFPANMRKTAMDDFEEEFGESDDLDKMEAKVATAKSVVKSYHDANMINKSRTTQFAGISHTAKAGMKTAKNDGGVPWHLRT